VVVCRENTWLSSSQVGVETWEGLEGEWLLWYYMGVGHILGGAVFLMLLALGGGSATGRAKAFHINSQLGKYFY